MSLDRILRLMRKAGILLAFVAAIALALGPHVDEAQADAAEPHIHHDISHVSPDVPCDACANQDADRSTHGDHHQSFENCGTSCWTILSADSTSRRGHTDTDTLDAPRTGLSQHTPDSDSPPPKHVA